MHTHTDSKSAFSIYIVCIWYILLLYLIMHLIWHVHRFVFRVSWHSSPSSTAVSWHRGQRARRKWWSWFWYSQYSKFLSTFKDSSNSEKPNGPARRDTVNPVQSQVFPLLNDCIIRLRGGKRKYRTIGGGSPLTGNVNMLIPRSTRSPLYQMEPHWSVQICLLLVPNAGKAGWHRESVTHGNESSW